MMKLLSLWKSTSIVLLLCAALIVASGCEPTSANKPSGQSQESEPAISSTAELLASSFPESEEAPLLDPVSESADVSSVEQPVASRKKSSASPAPIRKPADSSVPQPLTEPAPNPTIVPFQITQWRPVLGSYREKEDSAFLLRSSDELRSWMTELCDQELFPDGELPFYPISNETGALLVANRTSLETVVEMYRDAWEANRVVLALDCYYPGPAWPKITEISVQDGCMHVYVEASETDSESGCNRITTLAALPAEAIENVQRVEVSSQFHAERRYTPEVLPDSPYSTRRWRVATSPRDPLEPAVCGSVQELELWLDTNFPTRWEGCILYEPSYEDLDRPGWHEGQTWHPGAGAANSRKEILAQYAPLFERGGRLVALAFYYPYYGNHFHVVQQMERIDNRLLVRYDYYETSRISLASLETLLYLVEVDPALTQGVESVEAIETFYHAAWE